MLQSYIVIYSRKLYAIGNLQT